MPGNDPGRLYQSEEASRRILDLMACAGKLDWSHTQSTSDSHLLPGGDGEGAWGACVSDVLASIIQVGEYLGMMVLR